MRRKYVKHMKKVLVAMLALKMMMGVPNLSLEAKAPVGAPNMALGGAVMPAGWGMDSSDISSLEADFSSKFPLLNLSMVDYSVDTLFPTGNVYALDFVLDHNLSPGAYSLIYDLGANLVNLWVSSPDPTGVFTNPNAVYEFNNIFNLVSTSRDILLELGFRERFIDPFINAFNDFGVINSEADLLDFFNDLIVENPGHAPIFLGILTSIIVFDDLGISLDDLYTFISDSDKDLELFVGAFDVLGWPGGPGLDLPGGVNSLHTPFSSLDNGNIIFRMSSFDPDGFTVINLYAGDGAHWTDGGPALRENVLTVRNSEDLENVIFNNLDIFQNFPETHPWRFIALMVSWQLENGDSLWSIPWNEPLPPVITLKPDWAYMSLSVDVDANGGIHHSSSFLNMNFGENLLPTSWNGPHNLIRSISLHRPGYILTGFSLDYEGYRVINRYSTIDNNHELFPYFNIDFETHDIWDPNPRINLYAQWETDGGITQNVIDALTAAEAPGVLLNSPRVHLNARSGGYVDVLIGTTGIGAAAAISDVTLHDALNNASLFPGFEIVETPAASSNSNHIVITLRRLNYVPELRFSSNNGTFPSGNPHIKTVDMFLDGTSLTVGDAFIDIYNDTITNFEVPTRHGFTFGGWATSPTGSAVDFLDLGDISGTSHFYAVWEPIPNLDDVAGDDDETELLVIVDPTEVTEEPSEEEAEESTEKITEEPLEEETEESTEKVTERPLEEETEESTEKITEEPSEEETEELTEKVTERPLEEETEESTEEQTEEPTEVSEELTVEEPTEELPPVEEETEEQAEIDNVVASTPTPSTPAPSTPQQNIPNPTPAQAPQGTPSIQAPSPQPQPQQPTHPVLRNGLNVTTSVRETLNKVFGANSASRVSNGTYQIVMPVPDSMTPDITLSEITQLVNIPLEFEIVSREILNDAGELVNVYFFINNDGYLVFNVITVPLSVNVDRYALHSAHNHSRERVSATTSAQLLRLRMYYNRGDLTLRQFIHLRNEILKDEGIAASGLTLTPEENIYENYENNY